MKQRCPNCHTILEINEKEYTPGKIITKECPLCEETIDFHIPEVASDSERKNHEKTRTSIKTMPDTVEPQLEVSKEKEVVSSITNVRGIEKSNSENSKKTKSIVWAAAIISILIIGGVLFFFLNNNNNASSNVQEMSLNFAMTGTIGPSPATISFDGHSGNYSYLANEKKGTWFERFIRLESWDKTTGHLRLTSYDKNEKYIGIFDGIYHKGSGCIAYSGTFTNYKGVEISFDYKTEGTAATENVSSSVGTYLSADLKCYELYGPVKSVKHVSPNQTSETFFSSTGKLAKEVLDGNELTDITRDTKNRLQCIELNDYISIGHGWSYTETGNIDNSYYWHHTASSTYSFKYNNEGQITKIEYLTDCDPEDVRFKVSIEKRAIDSHGNWTERICRYQVIEYHNHFDESAHYGGNREYSETERREISYYN